LVRAVLFDLDDTLFDHRHCARSALGALHAAHEAFQSHPFDDFERLHASLLEELHRRVALGEVPLDVARRERFRRLFHAMGAPADEDTVANAAATYREGYRRLRQPVAGAAALLAAVRSQAAIGIVSNNLLDEQEDKLRHCGLDRYVDVLVVSEETGFSKPDPRIFAIALERLGVTADATVMIGDSWTADVVGARAAGIRAIWFNPAMQPRPEADDTVEELWSLEPVERVLPVILGDAPVRTGR
jgi:YjjG family noncanonical pyrimidine nucleotidase